MVKKTLKYQVQVNYILFEKCNGYSFNQIEEKTFFVQIPHLLKKPPKNKSKI